MNKISLILLGTVIFASSLPAMAEPDWQAIKLGHQHKMQKSSQAKFEALQTDGQARQMSDHGARMAEMMKQCDQMMNKK